MVKIAAKETLYLGSSLTDLLMVQAGRAITSFDPLEPTTTKEYLWRSTFGG